MVSTTAKNISTVKLLETIFSACCLSPCPRAMAVRGAARAHQHGKSVQQHQNGCEQPHAGQRCRANARNVADVNAVHDVIQQIHDLRYHGGDHELQHQLLMLPVPISCFACAIGMLSSVLQI